MVPLYWLRCPSRFNGRKRLQALRYHRYRCHMLMHNPTVGTFAGYIVEPIDVLTMDIHIPMGDILLTPMGDIILTPTGDIVAHFTGDGVFTNPIRRH